MSRTIRQTLKYIKERPDLVVALLLGLWLVLNLVQAALTPLSSDEIYYWYISKELAWGYFDHPPMFALLTRFGVEIGGDGAFWVRLGAVLLQPIYLYIFWTLVRIPAGPGKLTGTPAARTTWRSAVCYVLVAFSIPLLQLYGFVQTPDAPLMLFTACTLWSYRYYLRSLRRPAPGVLLPVGKSLGLRYEPIVGALLLGASMAGLAYAKYHGALIVLLLFASNPGLVRKASFWCACLFAALLITPHLMWQADHDWVSLRYHLVGRNNSFHWGNISEYLLNVLATFNPILLPVFVIYLVRKRSADRLERGLKFLSWGFFIFFGFSTLRGHVQPQWLIPVVFAMLYFLVRNSEGRPGVSRFLVRTGWVMAALFLAVRVFAMAYRGDAVRQDIFYNQRQAGIIEQQSGGLPLITDSYSRAAAYTYYTGLEAYAAPSIYTRSSQYEFLDTDTELYSQRVVQILAPPVVDSVLRGKGTYPLKTFEDFSPLRPFAYYDTVEFYIPSRKVEITATPAFPPKMIAGQEIMLSLAVRNPYGFDIPLGRQADGKEYFGFKVQFWVNRGNNLDVPLTVEPRTVRLAGGSTVQLRTVLKVPASLPTGKYKIAFTLQRYPFASSYNSPQTEVYIVNPNRR